MRRTLSGHKGKHRMAETSKGEAKAGGNPFPLYGSRREINGWEFSNRTGFQQNISVSTERPDSLKWKCFTKKHLFSDLLAELRQDATKIHLLLCWLSWRACHTCHVNHQNQRLHDFWTPWPANFWAALPSCATCPHHPLGKMEVHVCPQVMTVLRLYSLRACKGWPQSRPTSPIGSHPFPLKLE